MQIQIQIQIQIRIPIQIQILVVSDFLLLFLLSKEFDSLFHQLQLLPHLLWQAVTNLENQHFSKEALEIRKYVISWIFIWELWADFTVILDYIMIV